MSALDALCERLPMYPARSDGWHRDGDRVVRAVREYKEQAEVQVYVIDDGDNPRWHVWTQAHTTGALWSSCSPSVQSWIDEAAIAGAWHEGPALAGGYYVKRDPHRANGLIYTPLGPEGRLGPDLADWREALACVERGAMNPFDGLESLDPREMVRDAIASIEEAGDVHAALFAWHDGQRWARMLPERERPATLAALALAYRRKVGA